MKPVRIAQVGTGHGHASACWPTLNKNKDCFEVVGLCEPIEEYKDRPTTLKVYSGAKLYTLDELLAMDDLEAVAVEAGKEYSCEVAQKFADKGIPVFVDKPGSADVPMWEKFVNTMKAKKLPLEIGYMYRYNPLVREALGMVQRGELGDIFSVEAQMSVRHEADHRAWLGRYKGGMMYYLGCHLVDMICEFQGFPEEIIPMSCTTGTDGLDTEDMGFAVFKYKNGLSFAKTCGSEVNGFDRRQLVICGTKGTYEIRPWEVKTPSGYMTPAKLTKLENHVMWGNGATDIQSEFYTRYDPMMRHFAAMVRGEAEMLHDYDYEIQVFKTVVAACGAKNCTCGEDYE